MASTTATPAHTPATPETPIVVKVLVDGVNRKFKLPLKDLNPAQFHDKLKSVLNIPAEQKIKLERYSDSSSSYVLLEPASPWAYKQLYRAAKAKLKLRIRATKIDDTPPAMANTPITKETAADKASQPANAPVATAAVYQLPPPPPPPPMSTLPTFGDSTRSIPIRSIQSAPRPPQIGSLIDLAEPQKPFSQRPLVHAPVTSWQVYCNSCDQAMSNTHYHCSICDNGDYDLCQACVDNGKVCLGEGHWLVKRFINSATGLFTTSTTERIAPKPRLPPLPFGTAGEHMPGSFDQETKKEPISTPLAPTRTCNNCVRIMPERLLLSCKNCDDHDLCVPCFKSGKHGHHPAHSFSSIVPDLKLSPGTTASLGAGRGVRHAAICDGCDRKIGGVRHKCLDCPDWDFCGKCFEDAHKTHPGHRFAPLYDPLEPNYQMAPVHHGILCDGQLCQGKAAQMYIRGVRYKCAICHDVDFCSNCEAHPSNKHNATHPMIKFKTYVRGVSVTTLGEDDNGRQIQAMGDKMPQPQDPVSEEKATPLQTSENAAPETTPPVYTPRPMQGMQIPELVYKRAGDNPPFSTINLESSHGAPTAVKSSELDAHFICDTIKDGSELQCNLPFTQTWTMKNPGPHPWPVGCSVRFVGGDYMLNVDRLSVAKVDELTCAQESDRTMSEIPVGSAGSFTVLLRAPDNPGRKYISYWRLKAPDGTPFGHKLWCEIRTSGGPNSSGTTMLTGPENWSSGALADYQMQLMLREQEGKKRVMMGRGGNEPSQAPTETPPQLTAAQQYQNQLMLLEQENKRRLEKARQEQNLGVRPAEPAAVSESSPKQSTLVFPSLEKESPVPSIHEHQPASISTLKTETGPTSAADGETETETAVSALGEEVFEDVTDKDDFSDDAFLTDDEYDILDASDAETNDAPSHA